MKHVMIDIETLGTKSNSVFLSICAIPFDENIIAVPDMFHANIELNSAQNQGLTIDADTLRFWLEQRPEIIKKMFSNAQPLGVVLNSFSQWWSDNHLVNPWGNSARFDCGLIENGYIKSGISLPWKFWDERCYRTIVNLLPKELRSNKPEDAHDPFADCVYQYKELIKTLSHFNLPLC